MIEMLQYGFMQRAFITGILQPMEGSEVIW